MATNLFEDIKNKRDQVKKFAKNALDKKWLSENEYNNLINKIDNDTLTIGVIGQMKCGKSTFLNAFLFGEEVLPAATTPMTAALSVITYGKEKSIEIEFHNKNEWVEMQQQASRSIEEAGGDKATESKIKAAKELVEKSAKIGSELNTILGTSKNDKFERLIEYVGADGKYVALTKSVTIYYPEEWLKGVKVVDTPGFNDPVVSREERTQEFLKQADVVLMLLYAGRAFDATDRDIVFEKVRSVGIGKILIGINKYDIQFGQGETIEEITDNVKHEIAKACKEYKDDTIDELLLGLEPIPFSANMALMAKMPMETVVNNKNISFHWNKACDNFEISTQRAMLEKSLVKNLENAIKETIEKSKYEILLKKPINSILRLGENKLNEVKSQLANETELRNSLSLNDSDLDERISNLKKSNRRINRIIDNSVEELSDNFSKKTNKTIRHIEDDLETAENKAHSIIDAYSKFKKANGLERKLESFLRTQNREISRILEDTESYFKNELVFTTKNLSSELEDLLRKYLIDDYDEILHNINSTIKRTEFSEEGVFSEENSSGREYDFSWGDYLKAFLKGLLIFPRIDEMLRWKEEYHELIHNHFNSCDVEKIKSILNQRKDFYFGSLNSEATKQILPSLTEQLEELMIDREQREKKLQELTNSITQLDGENSRISQELAEMVKLKNEMAI